MKLSIFSLSRLSFVAVVITASFSSAFADCKVEWDSDRGGWLVTCTYGGEDRFYIPGGGGEEGGGGSGGGSCTNCTAMSPAVCAATKEGLEDSLYGLSVAASDASLLIGDIKIGVGNIRSDINSLYFEGRDFEYLSNSSGAAGLYFDNFMISSAQSSSQSTYIDPYDNNVSSWVSGANSIYTYYNTAVAPLLVQMGDNVASVELSLDQAEDSLQEVSGHISTLSALVEGMNCAACSAGSGSGSGSGSGTTPSGCPCAEFINAVRDAVDNCKNKLDDIDDKLDSIKTRLDSWDDVIKQIKNDVHQIRQTTDRMDDFFRDDTQYNFKKLIEHTLTLSNSVFSATVMLPPNLYWTEYTNATKFLDAEGSNIGWIQKGQQILTPSDGNSIDIGEYRNLNWFQRIEFLLGDIAGIFSPTNSAAVDFTEEQKAKIMEVEDDDAWNEITYDQPKSLIEGMISKVQGAERKLNPFYNVFSDPSSTTSKKVTILPDVSVENALIPDNTFPTVQIDLSETGDGSFSLYDLIELSHNITTFLAFAFFFIFDVFAIYKFVVILIAINRWYWKIYRSWVSTMFNGGGR